MRFGPVDVEDAPGKILGHNMAGPDGRRILRKGKRLTVADLDDLRRTGRSRIYVAELEEGDVDEDDAARRVAEAVAGLGIKLSRARVGRVNLLAKQRGVIEVDADRLARLNECEGVTFATLNSHAVVAARRMAGTVKVIPFAVPGATVGEAEQIARSEGPLIQVLPLKSRNVSLILSGSPYVKERILNDFLPPIEKRIQALGSLINRVDFVPLEDEVGEQDLADLLQEQVAARIELIILAGETAIMDRYDIAPRAVERAGGVISSFGAPVDPGNLLMLAYLGGVPVLGAPGCSRSQKINVIDWVLPPLLAGVTLSRTEIVQLGHGGLLEDVPERPAPRTRRAG